MTDKVLSVLGEICQETVPGKKMVQKLIYLIERKGVNLGLEYKIHFYGPYCSDLDQLLHAYEASNILEIDTTGKTHKIKYIKPIKKGSLSLNEEKIVRDVLDRYTQKTPLELELLTTTDFVAGSLKAKGSISKAEIISQVKIIKGSKFNEEAIENEITELEKFGLLKLS